MSEKLIAQCQAGFGRRRKPVDETAANLVGDCPGGKFAVVEGRRSV